MSEIITVNQEAGSWIECINPQNRPSHYFFAKPRFPDNQKICPMCWYFELMDNEYEKQKSAIGVITAPGFEKKYDKRNDRADVLPSKDYT